jgi:hypothetical protein
MTSIVGVLLMVMVVAMVPVMVLLFVVLVMVIAAASDVGHHAPEHISQMMIGRHPQPRQQKNVGTGTSAKVLWCGNANTDTMH